MGLKYQKRINLGKGLGLNVSQSRISTSYRTKYGSIGSKSFSIKTGIPGLSYRANWGKGGNGFVILFIYILVAGALIVAYNLIRFLIFLTIKLYQIIQSKLRKHDSQNYSG